MDCVEFVHLRLVSGTIDDLRRLRPGIVADFKRHYDVDAELFALEDGTFMDVWRWATRAKAEEAIADTTISAAFREWQEIVEVVSVQWAGSVSA